jgi:hypothetical protein
MTTEFKRRIVGLDVCKNRVVAWILEEYPRNFLKTFRENKRKDTHENPDPLSFFANPHGVKALLDLKPDAVALEPTGGYYSRIWALICKQNNIPVFWVGHVEARNYRKTKQLPDKNDQADALAIAAYTWENWEREDTFLTYQNGIADELRETYLQLSSITRMQSPVINRIRQQLAYEWPEMALVKTDSHKVGIVGPLWSWLAGLPVHKRTQTVYSRKYAESVARSAGIEVTPFTRQTASLLVMIQEMEHETEQKLLGLIQHPKFAAYHHVFNRFSFGVRLRGLLLSQVYPIQNYPTLGGFKRRLGLGALETSSGDKEGFSNSGAVICRTALYLYVLTTIAPGRKRPNSAIAARIAQFYDSRDEQLKNDPEAFKVKYMEQLQQRMLGQLRNNLLKELKGLMSKDAYQTIARNVESSIALMQLVTPQQAKDVSNGRIERRVGKLVINQTSAYTVRLLYKELRKIPLE